MPWYFRIQTAINSAVPKLLLTQKINLALLVSAILKKRKVEAGRRGIEARTVALCLWRTLRALPWPAARSLDQRDSVLEDSKEQGERSSAPAKLSPAKLSPAKLASGAVVSGDQLHQRQSGRRVVLAARLDRAVLQRLKRPLRYGGSAGWFSRAPQPTAWGTDHGPFVANSYGAAGDRRCAKRLPRFCVPAWSSLRDQFGPRSIGQTWQSAALLLTSINVRWLVGMRQSL